MPPPSYRGAKSATRIERFQTDISVPALFLDSRLRRSEVARSELGHGELADDLSGLSPIIGWNGGVDFTDNVFCLRPANTAVGD